MILVGVAPHDATGVKWLKKHYQVYCCASLHTTHTAAATHTYHCEAHSSSNSYISLRSTQQQQLTRITGKHTQQQQLMHITREARVPPLRLATPPRYQLNHFPTGNLALPYDIKYEDLRRLTHKLVCAGRRSYLPDGLFSGPSTGQGGVRAVRPDPRDLKTF